MKYETQPAFKADYKHLGEEARSSFKRAVRLINTTYDKHVKNGGVGLPRWPKELRIKPVTDAPGIYEMTWSFAGPDGRATFELFAIGRNVGIRWRRIGDHGIISIRKA